MRRHSPSCYSPPRRSYSGRGRSPPRRKYGGYGGRREQNSGSLLVRNIPLDCRPEDLRVPFERFGRVRDVYLPKDYYSGEPRGFAFVEFVDAYDASEAQYHMNRQRFGGREITVVIASETRKRPEDMRHRTRVRGPSYDDHRSSRYGHTLLYQDGEMIILSPPAGGTLLVQDLRGIMLKAVRRNIGSDHTLQKIETKLVMVMGKMRAMIVKGETVM